MDTTVVILICLFVGVVIGFLVQKSMSGNQLKILSQSLDDAAKKLADSSAQINAVTSDKVRSETQYHERDTQYKSLKSEYETLQRDNSNLKSHIAEVNANYQATLSIVEDQKKFIESANTALREAFSSLSSDALMNNNTSFLQLAKTELEKQTNDSKQELEKRQQAIEGMVTPLKESLANFNNHVQDIEKTRIGAYSEIITLISAVNLGTEKLEKGTNNLVSALKTSHIRGKYGEIGLRRLIEFTGLNDYCDFEEQVSVATDDGILRPDLIVKLPGSRKVVVDSKVPLSSYMMAFETTDEAERKELLMKHSLAVRDHLKKLSSKSYWNQFEESPDFVVMYMQIESSFGAALEYDRDLIEFGMNNGIIMATPTTLISVLKSIAFSWQQMKFAENIYHLRDASVELYSRVTTLLQHIGAVGNNLNSATVNYNKLVGSMENRFIPQVRKMKEIGGSLMDKEVPDLEKIDTVVRTLNELPEN